MQYTVDRCAPADLKAEAKQMLSEICAGPIAIGLWQAKRGEVEAFRSPNLAQILDSYME